jgi:hypothetical protein
MKRVIIYLGVLGFIAAGAGLTGCYKDVISPESDPDGPPQSVSFSQDLAPIFNAKCATSGCHASGGHKPYMETAISYQQIVNGGFVNTVIPKASILYQQVFGGMSEYIPSPKDKSKVYDWIRNGAPNN